MVKPVDDDDEWWRRGPHRDDFEDEDDEPDGDEDEDPVVECPQCGEDVFDDANQCPACGWWFIRDPNSIDMLKAKYKGIGHKTHLDHRHWIAVELNSDVPVREAKRLASLSYDLVCKAAEKPAKRAAKKSVRRVRATA